MAPSPRRLPHLALLWALYFVQGLPFGFQVSALPLLLREGGASLTLVGLSSALSTPWLLKPLWAPLVDRYWWPSIGKRKSWLLPMQLGLALTVLAAGGLSGRLGWLMGLVLLMNLFAATLDIAVDGYAVDSLAPHELGHGNTAQVVGYKLGMLTSGGLLLAATKRIGTEGMFLAMAGLIGAVALISWLALRESSGQRPASEPSQVAEPEERLTLGRIVSLAAQAFRGREARWLLAVVVTYKLGESMADAMFKPLLLDRGFDKAQIGAWLGTWGMGASIAGSLTGGWLSTRWPPLHALLVVAALRVLPLVAQHGLVLLPSLTPSAVIGVTLAEHYFGGALTTVMFTLMMARVDKRIGATHFTLLAAAEVLGKFPPVWLSGLLADRWGYPPVFAASWILSLLFLLLAAGFGRSSRVVDNKV